MADEKLLEQIKRDYRIAVDASSNSRVSQLDDQKFAAASSDNKFAWDAYAQATRTADGVGTRPMLTINIIPQHIRQVTNEQRQNRPAVKVLPVDDKADPETAKIFNGIIRHIEVSSDADIAIDTACESQVTHGEGYFRIVAEYCDADSFDQDLRVKRIRDPFSVRMDPRIQSPTGEDAKFCFIETEMSKDEFKAEFPDAAEISWDSADPNMLQWQRGENIVVAEYYHIESVRKTICLWPDGSVSVKGEKDYPGVQPLKERVASVPQIKWCKTNGFEILGDERDVPGPFIPVFRVVGNEWVINGEVIVSGIVRTAKDPLRMLNYWTSQEAEMLALAPKAPFIMADGQDENFEGEWRTANVVNHPVLHYNPIVLDGVAVPPPQRQAPPMPSQGIIEAKLQAIDAVKQTTGQYNPSLGAQGNETSGKAIIARQRESDVGTFHFVDNLDRALRSAGRYYIEVIPVYYDRGRVARIIGEDGEPDHATIDPTCDQACMERKNEETGEIEKIYNLSVGKYDVTSSVGPGYTTKRQEAAEFMATILQGNKELMAVMGDLYFGMLDVPGADEIAERLKRTIDPKLIGDEKGDSDPKLEQALSLIEQLTQAVNEGEEKLQAVVGSIEKKKVDIQAYDAETKRLGVIKEAIPPDMWPEIVINSGVLTSMDIDNISERGIVEQHPAAPPAGTTAPAPETVQ